jgi:hypothetical protein
VTSPCEYVFNVHIFQLVYFNLYINTDTSFFLGVVVALKRAVIAELGVSRRILTAEAVQCTPLPLQCVDYVHCSYGFALGMLAICYCITDDVFQEHLENSPSLLVDQTRDSFYSAPPRQTTDSRFGDALDVISQHFAVTLSASLSEPLASFTTSRHDVVECE